MAPTRTATSATIGYERNDVEAFVENKHGDPESDVCAEMPSLLPFREGDRIRDSRGAEATVVRLSTRGWLRVALDGSEGERTMRSAYITLAERDGVK